MTEPASRYDYTLHSYDKLYEYKAEKYILVQVKLIFAFWIKMTASASRNNNMSHSYDEFHEYKVKKSI